MKTDCIDHISLALCRLITQYQNSENLKAWLAIQAEQRQAIDIALCQMFLSFDKDTAIGRQLDQLGEIVGVNRLVENGEEKSGFFGFAGNHSVEAFRDRAALTSHRSVPRSGWLRSQEQDVGRYRKPRQAFPH